MKEKRNLTLRIVIPTLVIYFGLLALLIYFERGSDQSKIKTIGDAIWYSLVTLTTVGYGDYAPMTRGGHVIGCIFLLLSTGILVTLIGTAYSFLTGEALPMLILTFRRRRSWYYFADTGKEARTLAGNLYAEDPGAVIIFGRSKEHADDTPDFPCLFASSSPAALARRKGRRNTDDLYAFFMEENGIARNPRAVGIGRLPIQVYARTESGQNALTTGMHFFQSYDCCARDYWRTHSLLPEEHSIVIIGFGRYGQAILERAILTNVLAPDNHVAYHVFGEARHFTDLHHQLGQVFSLDGVSPDRDSILFCEEPFELHRDLLEQADRIIICEDDESAGWDAYWKLVRYFRLQGSIDLRTNRKVAGVDCFGADEDIYTPEHVMRTRLNAVAIAMNDLYRAQHSNEPTQTWEELDDALRHSKIAAADHMQLKVKLLLPEEAVDELDRTLLEKASRRYEELTRDEATLDRFRQIEHLRWLRNYAFLNWSYGATHDSQRREDPRVRPYAELSEVEKQSCEYAWKLIGEITL